MTMLRSWRDRASGEMSREDRICGFESALIACRLFLQFLGLKTAHHPLRLVAETRYFSPDQRKSDEVKVTDLGGEFVKIRQDLTREERFLLARVHHAASKATAHLSYGSRHGFREEQLPRAIDVISRLLHKRLYSVVKRPMEILK